MYQERVRDFCSEEGGNLGDAILSFYERPGTFRQDHETQNRAGLDLEQMKESHG